MIFWLNRIHCRFLVVFCRIILAVGSARGRHVCGPTWGRCQPDHRDPTGPPPPPLSWFMMVIIVIVVIVVIVIYPSRETHRGALIEFHCSGSWLLSNWPPNALEKYHIDILWWSMNPGLLSYAFFLSLQRLLKWSIVFNLQPLLQASQECGKTLPGSLFATRTSGESTSCVDRGCYDRVSQGDFRSSCPACKTLQCGQLDLCAHYGADGWGISMNLTDHDRSIESVICPDCHVHMSMSRRRWLQRIPWGPLFPNVGMAHGS